MSEFVFTGLPDNVQTVYMDMKNGRFIIDEAGMLMMENMVELLQLYQKIQEKGGLESQNLTEDPNLAFAPLLDPSHPLFPLPLPPQEIELIDLTKDEDEQKDDSSNVIILSDDDSEANDSAPQLLPYDTITVDDDDAASDATDPMYTDVDMAFNVNDDQNIDEEVSECDEDPVIVIDDETSIIDNSVDDETKVSDREPSPSTSNSSLADFQAEDPSEECEISMDTSENFNESLDDEAQLSDRSPSPRASSSSSEETTDNNVTVEAVASTFNPDNTEISNTHVPKTSSDKAKTRRSAATKVKIHPTPSFTNRCKPRKSDATTRSNFDNWKIEKLETRFGESPYITAAEKTALAKKIQLSVHQVGVWFQNRRVKEKKGTQKKHKQKH